MLTEEQKRMHRVCFTGHRPEKLKQSESVIVKALETAIKEAIADGKNVFISGMARGVDIWAAEIVLRLRKEGANVKLICASPYEGFERGWSAEWQRRYNVILAAADLVRFICPGYSRACFQIRNEWMVDHSALVIAVFNGQPSGTKNTIDYAKRKSVPCWNTQLQSKTQEQQKTGVTKNLKTSFKCYHRNSLYKRLYNDLSFGEKDNLAFSPYLQQSRKQMMCQGRRKPFILPFAQQMFSAISFVRDIILYCSRDTVSPQSNIPFV